MASLSAAVGRKGSWLDIGERQILAAILHVAGMGASMTDTWRVREVEKGLR